MRKKTWEKAAVLGITLGMLITSVPFNMSADEVFLDDELYFVAEDDTEETPETEIVESYEESEFFDDSVILEENEPEIADSSVLGIFTEGTEEALYAREG